MIHFLLGFLTAIALIAMTVIVWAVIAHRRQERQRQQGINAIITKIMADTPLPEGTRLELFRKQPSSSHLRKPAVTGRLASFWSGMSDRGAGSYPG